MALRIPILIGVLLISGCKPLVAPPAQTEVKAPAIPATIKAPEIPNAPLVSTPKEEAPISQSAINLIIESEVTSQSHYNRSLTHPEWPGAESGVTIGIGDDLGYQSQWAIKTNWHALRSDWLNSLADTAGITGVKAKPVAASLSFIIIEWGLATQVFNETTIPEYWVLTKKTFPGVEDLCPNAAGALTSLIYNRGSSLVGPRRREMATIKQLVPKKDYRGIANQIIAMKRLWEGQNEDGLLSRRDDEAKLILTCINN